MAARRNGFWSNFWRESGRNTGKWLSNKIFGNSGWATPKRVILEGLDKDESLQRRKKAEHDTPPPMPADAAGNVDFKVQGNRQPPQRFSAGIGNYHDAEDAEEREEQKLFAEARAITLNSGNASLLAGQLDKILTAAITASGNLKGIGLYESRLRTGIMLLKRLNEPELAAYYEEECRRLSRHHTKKKTVHFIVILVMILALICIALFLDPLTFLPKFLKNWLH